MKVLFALSISVFLLNACSQPHKSPEKEEITSELTLEQQSAFDALNKLQISTDKMNRLYSTFAGVDQPCYPPDTSFTISQSDLLMVMKQFVANNCTRLTVEEQDDLATTCVLTQEEYTLSICFSDSTNITPETGVPMAGTWILPKVLNRRDVIIVW